MNLISVYSRDLDATKLLYEMLRERSTEEDAYVNISHRALPTWKEHVAFVRSKPFRAWYIIRIGTAEAIGGNCYLTWQNEVGIILVRAWRGLGFGPVAVKLMLERHKPLKAIPAKRRGHFIANINPANDRSVRMFESLGFHHLSNTYELA